MSPKPTGAAINPIADGVGVMGKTGFVTRFLFGVDGEATSSFEEGTASVVGFLRFFEMLAIFGGVDDFVRTAFSFASNEAALMRAERLDDIVKLLDGGEQKQANTGLRVETVRRCSLMADERTDVVVVLEQLRDVPIIVSDSSTHDLKISVIPSGGFNDVEGS